MQKCRELQAQEKTKAIYEISVAVSHGQSGNNSTHEQQLCGFQCISLRTNKSNFTTHLILWYFILNYSALIKIVWSGGTSIKHIWHNKRLNLLGVFHLAIATWHITVYILFHTMSFFNVLIMSAQFSCQNAGNWTPNILASQRYMCYLLQKKCADILSVSLQSLWGSCVATMFVWNFGNHLSSDTVSYPRPASSASLLWDLYLWLQTS
jgi:hypothetical protein